ncbi:MAG: hypothetical protein ACOVLD_09665 [Bacteroidia bacterium]
MSIFQTALSTDKGLNYTNIGLMIISAAMSFFFPFQLFLFAYAFLGPLHYLTEISWLEKRNFFTDKKRDIWLFILMGVLFTVPVFFKNASINAFSSKFLMLAFFFAIIIFFVKNDILKYALTIVSFFVLMSSKDDYNSQTFLWFGVMLPTIIHVFIFTGLFILYGALKNRSVSGILSIVVFIACSICLLFFIPSGETAMPDSTTEKNIGNFEIMNRSLILIFGLDPSVIDLQSAFALSKTSLFTSPVAVVVARFIAFAYTYHYLNWFSKTTVIKWHEVPKTRLALILVLWIGAIASYLIDYNFGFKVLFLLSILHVMLEFPLNLVTLKGIGVELKSIFTKK